MEAKAQLVYTLINLGHLDPMNTMKLVAVNEVCFSHYQTDHIARAIS